MRLTAPVPLAGLLYAGLRRQILLAVAAIAPALTAQITLVNGFVYNGQVLADSIQLDPSNYAYFTGGTTFTGPGANFGNSAGIYWQQVGILTGKTLTMGAGAYLYVSNANSSVTLGVGTVVNGDVSIYSDGSANTAITNLGTINYTDASTSGQIYADTFTNEGSILATAGTLYLGYPSAGYDSVNTATGTITSDGSGTSVYIRGNFDNNGLLTAQNSGLLRFDGTSTTANLGNVTLATGGRALLQGTIDNTATTLTAPTGGSYELFGGTITGGTVATGALTFTSSGGYLSGASLTGDLTLGASAHVRFTNGASFTGANLALDSNASFHWHQVGTLADKDLSFANGSYVQVHGVNSTLTLDSLSTATGTIFILSDGSNGTTVTNQGTLNHQTGNGSLYSRIWANEGTINVTGGSLTLGTTSTGYSFSNEAGASIVINGATAYFGAPAGSPFLNAGLVAVQSGTLNISNTLRMENGGVLRGAGTVSGDLDLAGGTLAPGNSIGTLTVSNSDFLVSAPASFEVELGGATADRVTFLNPTSTVDLGDGLLSLSLVLLSAPVEWQTYTLMDIGSGANTLAGYFTGLPNSGDAITANFGGTDYHFHVTYLANSFSVTAVPEPGTYALMAVGLGIIGLIGRRRRRR